MWTDDGQLTRRTLTTGLKGTRGCFAREDDSPSDATHETAGDWSVRRLFIGFFFPFGKLLLLADRTQPVRTLARTKYRTACFSRGALLRAFIFTHSGVSDSGRRRPSRATSAPARFWYNIFVVFLYNFVEERGRVPRREIRISKSVPLKFTDSPEMTL